MSQQSEQWFLESYAELSECAYQTHPGLLVFDCHNILNELSERVPTCRCQSRGSFSAWAKRFVRRRAQQIKDTEVLLIKYRKTILSAIRRSNDSWVKDAAVEVDDILSEITTLVYKKVDDLIKEGIAKPSTRLYGLAKTHVLRYHTMPRKRRYALITAQVAAGGKIVGAFSAAELAAEKYSEFMSSCS